VARGILPGMSTNATHDGRYWVVRTEPTSRVVRLTRTSVSLSTLDEMLTELAAVERALEASALAGFGILMDLRAGPMRNDDAFELQLRPYRERLSKRFARVAVLISTAVGRLQMTRLAKDAPSAPRVFADENEALRYLEHASR
jgi:hypothetical protein